MPQQITRQSTPIQGLAILKLESCGFRNVRVRWNDFFIASSSTLVQLGSIEVKQDSANEVVSKSEPDGYSQRYGRRAETKDLAAIDERHPLVEERHNEVKHGAADLNGTLAMTVRVRRATNFVACLSPVDETIVETYPELRFLKGV